MNILLLTDTFPPRVGGVEHITSMLACTLTKMGHNVTVVTLMVKGASKYEIRNGYEVYRIRMTFPRLELKGAMDFLLSLWGIFRLLSILKKRNIQVINAHYPVSSSFLIKILTGKKESPPLILSFHGTDIQDFIAEYPGLKRTVKCIARRAKAITACSRYLANIVEKTLNVPGVITLHNGIPVKIRGEEVTYREGNYIFSIGRFVKKKGFEMLIDAFFRVSSDFPKVKLIIAGTGPEKEKIEQKIRNYHLQGKVHLPGRVNDEEKERLLHGCLFAVIPSLEEPFGITAIEAMAAGKAVLATEVGGLPEVLGECGLIVEPNDHGVERGMRSLLTDPALRKKLSSLGRERVKKKFSTEKMVERYLQLYKEM